MRISINRTGLVIYLAAVLVFGTVHVLVCAQLVPLHQAYEFVFDRPAFVLGAVLIGSVGESVPRLLIHAAVGLAYFALLFLTWVLRPFKHNLRNWTFPAVAHIALTLLMWIAQLMDLSQLMTPAAG